MREKYQVKIQPGANPYPHELSAAQNIANYFKCPVLIIRNGFAKSADFLIRGVIWELKSPIGGGKYTIKNNIRSSKGQSDKIILDLRRCKLPDSKAIANIGDYFHKYKHRTHVKKLLVINKQNKVVSIL